jgi:hypothetical protein
MSAPALFSIINAEVAAGIHRSASTERNEMPINAIIDFNTNTAIRPTVDLDFFIAPNCTCE